MSHQEPERGSQRGCPECGETNGHTIDCSRVGIPGVNSKGNPIGWNSDLLPDEKTTGIEITAGEQEIHDKIQKGLADARKTPEYAEEGRELNKPTTGQEWTVNDPKGKVLYKGTAGIDCNGKPAVTSFDIPIESAREIVAAHNASIAAERERFGNERRQWLGENLSLADELQQLREQLDRAQRTALAKVDTELELRRQLKRECQPLVDALKRLRRVNMTDEIKSLIDSALAKMKEGNDRRRGNPRH